MDNRAQRVYDFNKPKQERRWQNPYMTNLQHPAIGQLFVEWRMAQGSAVQYPASDAERTAFELWLLRPEVAEKICRAAENPPFPPEVMRNG